MDTWKTRQVSLENVYMHGEEEQVIEKYIKNLVKEGKLSNDALENINKKINVIPNNMASSMELPKVEIRKRPTSEFIYHHTPSKQHVPNFPKFTTFGIGQVNMGRARWSVDDVSIFNLKEGKKLSQEPLPVRKPSIFEMKQAAAIEKAANDTPLVGKYRLYPKFSAGRALLWGTLLSLTGTAIGTKLACLYLDIREVDDVSGKVRVFLEPLKNLGVSYFHPLSHKLLLTGNNIDSVSASSFAKKLKENV